jgi:hypothetical protein
MVLLKASNETDGAQCCFIVAQQAEFHSGLLAGNSAPTGYR